jgi:hypothetical protein
MADLKLLAQAELDGEQEGEVEGIDFAEHWITNGGTMIGLAAKLQKASESDSAGAYEPKLEGGGLARMLRRTFGDQRVDVTLARARARGSHAMVESTHEIADEPVLSSEDASRARNRIGTRQWSAAAYERGTFGQRGTAPVVNVNLGVLHLDAMRQRTITGRLAIAQVGVNLPDEQLVTDAEVTDPALDDVRDDVATS